MKTILIIGYVWPEPHSSAAGSHMLSIIQLFVDQSWRVIFATPAQTTDYNFDLNSIGVETLEITLNSSQFDQTVAKLDPTIVLFDRFMMEEQFGWRVAENCPNAIRILDTEDLQCLRGARHTALKQKKTFTLTDLNNDLAKREIASIFRCDLSLIISDYEVSILIDYFGVDPSLLLHLPFMLDLTYLDSHKPNFEQRKHFVTIGNLRHAPNWDSIIYLQEIWPLIRKKLPNTELHIYGAYTPPKATALNNPSNGFLIKDRASDVNEVMIKARVCLSPLRFGAGIKGKFVDAMLNQTPSITTDIGAEGMTGDLDWPGIIENNPQQIVEAAVKLYQTEALWQEKSEQCRTVLEARYKKSTLQEKLLTRILELEKNLTHHRDRNFIGGMLNFHIHRSTKFMSKWIEEKNKNL